MGIKVEYVHMGSYSIEDIWLNTEAGVDYIIRQSTQGYRVKFWAEEVGTGKVVGSIIEDGIFDEEKH